jgi:hypothetical protein
MEAPARMKAKRETVESALDVIARAMPSRTPEEKAETLALLEILGKARREREEQEKGGE